ncbi:MAG: PilN domain-containing protein [Phycisphaerae bacterium]|nr:PilN domain-containing protein [Phycisphaerae bacterium]
MNRIDFLPEHIRAHRARNRRLVRQGYFLAACVLVLATVGYFGHRRVGRAQAELTALSKRDVNFESQMKLREQLEQQEAELLTKKRIDDQMGSSVSALLILAEVSRLQPQGLALTSLKVEAKEVRIPIKLASRQHGSSRAVNAGGRRQKEKVVKRVRLSITGLAPTDVDIADFIGQLSASPMFEQVNMGYARSTTFRGRSAREFQASCYVVR